MALVSVIIPAFNAGDTVAGTLSSARAQTFKDLEIIVVDDGSTDATAAIAMRHAQEDSRVRLLQRANGGVARARNLAIASAHGAFVAPLDADDIWHPQKLEMQLERLRASPAAGLAYGWFRRIDQQALTVGASASPVVEGMVFHRHLAANFISNGSAPLIRREALEGLSYEPALRDADAEGCEDYLIQLQIARRWPFVCAPGFLVGYRRRKGAMSNDVGRMIRSHIAVFELMRQDAPPSALPTIQRRLAGFHIELARNRLRRGQVADAVRDVMWALKSDPREAFLVGGEQIQLALASRPNAISHPRPFDTWALHTPNGRWRPDRRLLDPVSAQRDLELEQSGVGPAELLRETAELG